MLHLNTFNVKSATTTPQKLIYIKIRSMTSTITYQKKMRNRKNQKNPSRPIFVELLIKHFGIAIFKVIVIKKLP